MSKETDPVRPRIEGVIFDLDGTLTKPGAIDFARIRKRIGMTGSGSILDWIERAAANTTEAREMIAIVEEEERLALELMQLAEGFDELAEALVETRDRSGSPNSVLHRAICTRNSMEALDAFDRLVTASGYADASTLFGVRIARDHHSSTLGRSIANKPSPDPAHEIVRAWGADQRFPPCTQADDDLPTHPSLLFVGDSIDDCLCGRRAGFTTTLVTGSARARVEGVEEHPAVCRVVDGLSAVATHLVGSAPSGRPS